MEAHAEPFAWGKLDCLLFVSNWCKKMSGVDPAALGRGKYETKRDAYFLLKKERGGLQECFDYHFDRVDQKFAQTGDVVVCELDAGKTCGIIGGQSDVAWFKTPKGVLVRSVAAIACWRLPCQQ